MSPASTEPNDPDNWLRQLAQECGVEFVARLSIPGGSTAKLLPAEIVRRFHVVPIETGNEEDAFALTLATSAPHDFAMMDALHALLQSDLAFVAAPAAEIDRIINRLY